VIRYAAFCSTLTFEAAVELRAKFAGVSVDAARQEIREFVEDPGFSTLDKKPRMILAAGNFDNQELTSCVLWLRDFGVDIQCVEVTPYRLGNEGHLILVPRVIIPLPQAKNYIVSAEEKEAEQGTKILTETKNLQRQFWVGFVRYCEEKGSIPQLISNPPFGGWYQIKLGFPEFFLELKALTQPATLACQVVLTNRQSASIYQQLESQKSEIEAEVNARQGNAPLEWMRPSAEGKRGRIVQARPADIESQGKWMEYFAWLMERAEAFYKAFLPRLQAITHAPRDTG